MLRILMIAIVLSVSYSLCAVDSVKPVTEKRLLTGTDDTSSWLMYGGNYENWRYSPLEDINRYNVSRLAPVWMFQTGLQGQLSASPIVVDGVMYMTAPYNNLWALDASDGRILWHYEHLLPGDLRICCGPINRGVAISGNTLFMATLDARLIAFDRVTGDVLWNVQMGAYAEGYSASSAPLVVGNLVISGIAGGEYGARGFIDAYTLDEGELVWRTYTVPGEGEPGVETWAGDSWKTGGAPTWSTGIYDPETGLLLWPVGNPSPDWNGDTRAGDNLYSNSVVALDPKTGDMKWYFQYTPHDVWDYDATNGLVLTNMDVEGQKTRVLLQPNRNGYVYVLNAVTGKFIKGFQYTDRLNWSTGLSPEGRPIVNEEFLPTESGSDKFICPGNVGGNNGAYTYSWSPRAKMMFVPSIESCAKMVKENEVFVSGQPFWGGGPGVTEGETGEAYGRFLAIDPVSATVKWKYRDNFPMLGGALSTGGRIVFTGNQEGHALALDEATGKLLWSFPTGSAIRGQPITWKMDGRQYVAIPSGGGGIAAAIVGAPPMATLGSTLVVFALPR